MKRIFLILGLSLLLAPPIQAELYMAGQLGVHLPQTLSNVKFSVGRGTVQGNNLSQLSSFAYGAKLGYYFEDLSWIGVETEVYNATPHFERQTLTLNGSNFGTLAGANHRVLMWSPLTVVMRYQLGALEPYAGVGAGVFFSHLSSGQTSSSDTAIGLNTQVGLRYRLNQHFAAFVEWKYNRAGLNHTNIANTGIALTADYSAHILMIGLGYHF
jgi:opacity protein-like surface antigen